MSKGFTLAEMLVVIGMLIFLICIAMYVFSVVLFSWVSEEARAGLGIELDRAVNMIARDVREATESTPNPIKWKYPNELRFAVVHSRQADGTPVAGSFDYYIYYFYNASDRYPNAFTQSAYDLKRCPLTVAAGYDPTTGTFTYGNGQIVANRLSPASSLTVNGDAVIVDLSITAALADLGATNDVETMRVRTEIVPRNTQ